MLGKVRSRYMRLAQFMTYNVRLGQVWPGQVRLSHVRTGYVSLGQDM
jgi:hypothetical protein